MTPRSPSTGDDARRPASGLTGRQRSAIRLARAAGASSRRLGVGGGAALPGRVAGRLSPDLLEALVSQLGAGVVTVTGTNGKTTTSHLLAALATSAGADPVTNRTGSNLERGVLGALMDAVGRKGVLPRAPDRLGVFEVDEAALVGIFPRVRPRVALFLNLFRDQLDRYAEVDRVVRRWRSMLDEADWSPTRVLNADDPQISQLSGHGDGPVVTFGIDSPEVALDQVEHATDANFCTCGALLDYDHAYMGHVGVWRCDTCGRRREAPDVVATDVTVGDESAGFTLVADGGRHEVALPVTGLYTVYNALAAYASARALGFALEDPAAELARVGPVFGRQERMEIDGREVRLLLAKNPIGLNEVLRALRSADKPLRLVVYLNDNIADGRDVSWIYDADLEQLAGRTEHVVASGTRASELALRLDLAGISPDHTTTDLLGAFDAGLAATPRGERLDLVLTYTAMLEVREKLVRRTSGAQYWKATS